MSRPKRRAAAAAQERMQQIFEWEQAPENSKLFRDCAAAIDAEFERERKSKRVKVEEIEDSEECEAVSCDEEHAEEITQEDIDFVEPDGYTTEDAEWVPEKHKAANAGAGKESAEAGAGDGASEESSEEDDAEESEEEAQMTSEDEDAEDTEDEDAEDEGAEAEDAEDEDAEDAEDEAEHHAPAAPAPAGPTPAGPAPASAPAAPLGPAAAPPA
jgi:hypothetical protein